MGTPTSSRTSLFAATSDASTDGGAELCSENIQREHTENIHVSLEACAPAPAPSLHLGLSSQPQASPLSRDEKPSAGGRRRLGWGQGLAARGLTSKAAPTTPRADDPVAPAITGDGHAPHVTDDEDPNQPSSMPVGATAGKLVGLETAAAPSAALTGLHADDMVPSNASTTTARNVSSSEPAPGDLLSLPRLTSDSVFHSGSQESTPLSESHDVDVAGKKNAPTPQVPTHGPSDVRLNTPSEVPESEHPASVASLGSAGSLPAPKTVIQPCAHVTAADTLVASCSSVPATALEAATNDVGLPALAPTASPAPPPPTKPDALPAMVQAGTSLATASGPAPAVPVKPGQSREELLLQIDELESSIEETEAKIEEAEAYREHMRRASEAEAARQANAARTAASQGGVPGSIASDCIGASTNCDLLPGSMAARGELVELLYALNAQRAEQARSTLLARSGLPVDAQRESIAGVQPTAQPIYAKNLAFRQRFLARLQPIVARRVQELSDNAGRLRDRYVQLQSSWEGTLVRRERERDARLKRREQKEEEAAQAEKRDAGGRAVPMGRQGSGLYGGSRNRSLGSSDAVRSEEEMMAVIAQLAAAEKREKTSEWIAKQCACAHARMRACAPFRARGAPVTPCQKACKPPTSVPL